MSDRHHRRPTRRPPQRAPGFDDLRLTEWTSCGGAPRSGVRRCSRTSSPTSRLPTDPSLLVGLAPFDDAAVYRVSDDVAIVSTTDFFPPLVDHPADFGAIAAANACSDVFAMGGRVVMAINVAAFPEHFPREAIAAIFEAAATVVAEAGGSVAGGHTIRNPEPIFGLAVQGVVHPDRVFRKGGARAGDVLVLSKPIGTGLALAAGTAADKAVAIAGMRRLNRAAVGDAAVARRRGARRHRRHRVRARRSRVGGGRAQPGAGGRRHVGHRRLPGRRRGGRRAAPAPAAIRATATTWPGTSTRPRPPVRRRCASTRRRRAGCSPPSIPTLRGGRSSPTAWWRVGEIESGAPRLVLR